MNLINENNLTEQPLLEWFTAQGYEYAYGPDIAPNRPSAERGDFRDAVLKNRLLSAIRRFNPQLPAVQAEEVANFIAGYNHADLTLGNKEIYHFITGGVKKTWHENGIEKSDIVKLVDFHNTDANELLVVNQFTLQGIDATNRFDTVIFLNGLPIAMFELKSGSRDTATIGEAYRQVERYKKETPRIFLFNQIIVLSDLFVAKHGTVSSSWERFGVWKGVTSPKDIPKHATELEVLAKGLFDRERLLDVLQNFFVYEADGDGDAVTYTKKMCLYHQYYGINDTIASALRAVKGDQERKVGVFWHTQGSGKSLSMVFFVNKTKHIPELMGPAYLFLTDREDLDSQLHATFSRTGYGPLAKRADSIADLGHKLKHLGSELIFTTIQKFQNDEEVKVLSDRKNLIVLADEAHRSQYSVFAGNVRRALPNASFLGVTGTPIAQNDRDTFNVFGPVVSSYKIGQAVEDGATVKIYYEGRLVPLHLADKFVDSKLDDLLGEIVTEEKARARAEWAALEQVVGSQSRIERVARDIVEHFNNRPISGKAMIVTMSRRIAVLMYQEIKKITGSPECAVIISNAEEFTGQIQDEKNAKALEKRFKKISDPLKIAIVCDMWLTGFDVPSVHTMYLDKPLKNHGLMQAIARVNRVYKDKPGGLIVDYIGIAENLKKALAMYDSDVQENALLPLEEIVSEMHRVRSDTLSFLGTVDMSGWKKLSGVELSHLLQESIEAVISENGLLSDQRKMAFIGNVGRLSKLHALVMPSEEAMKIVSDVQFLQAVRVGIYKKTVVPKAVFPEATESAIRDILEGAVGAEEIVNLFASEGESKSISIFDPAFVEEIKKVQFKNFSVDAIRRLLGQEITGRMKTNKARYETMLTMLSDLIEKYENGVISSSEIIKRLLEIADEIKKLDTESQSLGLSQDELAFYDTLQSNPDLTTVGIDIKDFVKELTRRIRRDLTIDWTDNENIKARIRQNVRLLLIQKGITEMLQTDRLIESIYMEAVRVYREYTPA